MLMLSFSSSSADGDGLDDASTNRRAVARYARDESAVGADDGGKIGNEAMLSIEPVELRIVVEEEGNGSGLKRSSAVGDWSNSMSSADAPSSTAAAAARPELECCSELA